MDGENRTRVWKERLFQGDASKYHEFTLQFSQDERWSIHKEGIREPDGAENSQICLYVRFRVLINDS